MRLMKSQCKWGWCARECGDEMLAQLGETVSLSGFWVHRTTPWRRFCVFPAPHPDLLRPVAVSTWESRI